MISRYFGAFLLLFVVSVMLNFYGCFYSFTGASVPSHMQTVAIPIVEDRSGSAEAGLSESFTSILIRKFIDDNTLQVSERANADGVVENTIVSLSDNPVVITPGEVIANRRITIAVRTVFRDLVTRKVVFDRQFSNYGDYSTDDYYTNRQTAIQTAIDRITDDILIGTVSNW